MSTKKGKSGIICIFSEAYLIIMLLFTYRKYSNAQCTFYLPCIVACNHGNLYYFTKHQTAI